MQVTFVEVLFHQIIFKMEVFHIQFKVILTICSGQLALYCVVLSLYIFEWGTGKKSDISGPGIENLLGKK